MFVNPWVTFGAGVLLGAVAPRVLLGQPEGRRAVKTVLKGGLAVYDWVAAQVETLREDVADLAAEAMQEQAAAGPAPATKQEQAAAGPAPATKQEQAAAGPAPTGKQEPAGPEVAAGASGPAASA